MLVSIPAVRVRYISSSGVDFAEDWVSIPAVRVRYIAKITKAHKKFAVQFVQLSIFTFYYSESLKLCLPFAQKSKKIFPVFIFSPVRGPVL